MARFSSGAGNIKKLKISIACDVKIAESLHECHKINVNERGLKTERKLAWQYKTTDLRWETI
ncbi:hypothetical protein HYT23_07000 [Candidatus Pacearchaeota archaeon]|nr:hypothetical protein [Candidatus Pacearchaeota archaeon]